MEQAQIDGIPALLRKAADAVEKGEMRAVAFVGIDSDKMDSWFHNYAGNARDFREVLVGLRRMHEYVHKQLREAVLEPPT